MAKPLAVIIAGSKSDESHYQKIATAARELGLDAMVHIGSAHKTPEHVIELLERYEGDPRPKVYITVAGRSNALSGFIDGYVSAPVIACPPYSEAFGGTDIFSSLRMPSGIAPAVILDPQNAALFAAKILGLNNSTVHNLVIALQEKNAEQIIRDDEQI